MSELQALVFDVDGTLADTERDGHRVAFNRAFEEAGLDWHWTVDLYGQLLTVTGGKERIRYFLDHFEPAFAKPDDLDGFIARLHQRKTAHYRALMSEGAIPLRPGIRRVLEQARSEGLRLAIATTTTPENVSALLENAFRDDAMSWFEVVGAGDIVPAKKPAPDIYTWVLERMGLNGDQVIAFEDSGHGVSSATAAKIGKIVVTTNGYTEGQNFSSATSVLDTLGEPNSRAHCKAGTEPPEGFVDIGFLRRLMN